jgi:hypothetical protein
VRPTVTQITAAALAAFAGFAIVGCQGSGLPLPPNGPQSQSFSTNNALLRFVDGSPNAGVTGCAAGTAACSVQVVIDGTTVTTAAGTPFNPSDSPISSTISSYYSFPSGQALIQVFQFDTVLGAVTTNLVFEGAVTVKAGSKYSFVLGGQGPALPPPAPPFYPGYLFTDGSFLLQGVAEATFHNGSPNAGGLQFSVTCTSCPAGGQKIGSSNGTDAATIGPVSLLSSGGYSIGATNGTAKSITPAQLDGANTGNQLPDPVDPLKRPNVSIYAVDTTGIGAADYELIGTLDSNG